MSKKLLYLNLFLLRFLELVPSRGNRHRGQVAGRGAGHDRNIVEGQHKGVGADGGQDRNCAEHRQLVQAHQRKHEVVRVEEQQLRRLFSFYQL